MRPRSPRLVQWLFAVVLCLTIRAAAAENEDLLTVFPHPTDTRFFIAGQVNLITQANPPFFAAYTGGNSFLPEGQVRTSFVTTLYTGISAGRWTHVYVDVEMSAGNGLSDALGIAGFTNLDVVRNPTLGAEPYLARAVFHQVIPLGDEMEDVGRTAIVSVNGELPSHRLEFRAGRFSTADLFDQNAYGTDSHLQFLNWTVDNNGAYDYAADTRGYTWGLVIDYHRGPFAVRFGELLLPKEANGLEIQWDPTQAHSENLELEAHYSFAGRNGAVRLLGYSNYARMGNYQQAIDAFLHGDPGRLCTSTDIPRGGVPMPPTPTARPCIEATRDGGRFKLGLGLNLEQNLIGPLNAFARLGWNDGRNESFCYTEVDDTLLLGLAADPAAWGRPLDHTGMAFVSNGISPSHRQYLALGGQGFILGDGALTYGREIIVEGYYTAWIWRGTFLSADLQAIWNPGYNQVRGPVLVGAVRLHVDL